MWFVVGLGNPGARYARTRHNAGFRVADTLARRWGVAADRERLGAHLGEGRVAGRPALLAKPQAFMNRSGGPVADILGWRGGAPGDLIVAHDELDLPFGVVRIKRGGGTGGHKGLADIDRALGERGYLRVRVGISRPPAGQGVSDYVLDGFAEDELERVDAIIDAAADAVELILREGADRAMNRVNVRPKKPKPPAPEPPEDTPTVPHTTHQGPDPEPPAPPSRSRS